MIRTAAPEALFVDSSVLVAIAFGERGAATLADRLNASAIRFASPLVEAEFLSSCRREQREPNWDLLDMLQFAYPGGPLRDELRRVLTAGYLRGADCWHLATALHLAPDPSALVFLTNDLAQREVAQRLGFAT